MKKVKVYSTSTCSFCVKLKQFLKDNNVEFEDIDVSQNQERVREMVEKTGQMGVPVIDVEGEIIVGFDRARIMKALEL